VGSHLGASALRPCGCSSISLDPTSEVQPATQNWLILLAIVSLAAGARVSLPTLRLLPTTKVLAEFPPRVGRYFTTGEEFVDSEPTRRVYAPAAIVYRDYRSDEGIPLNLFIAPEPVGWHTPETCVPYQGTRITQRFLRPIPAVPGLVLDEVALLPASAEGSMNICVPIIGESLMAW
jgi:hypothetical protein